MPRLFWEKGASPQMRTTSGFTAAGLVALSLSFAPLANGQALPQPTSSPEWSDFQNPPPPNTAATPNAPPQSAPANAMPAPPPLPPEPPPAGSLPPPPPPELAPPMAGVPPAGAAVEPSAPV